MIEKSDIEKLANLARISVTEDEAEGLSKDIGAVLGYIESLQEISGFEGDDHMRAHSEAQNSLRSDTEAHEPGKYTEALLAQAPDSEKGFFKVKKILSTD